MARGPEEKNESTIACGPTTLVKNHYSVPVEWVNLHELNDEFAIFKAWPSEQNRVAATHLLAVPELKWAKEEGGLTSTSPAASTTSRAGRFEDACE